MSVRGLVTAACAAVLLAQTAVGTQPLPSETSSVPPALAGRDGLLRAVLVKLFADRQLAVDPAVIDYLLVRMERSMEFASRVVSEIDRQALAMQRGVTKAVASVALDALDRSGRRT